MIFTSTTKDNLLIPGYHEISFKSLVAHRYVPEGKFSAFTDFNYLSPAPQICKDECFVNILVTVQVKTKHVNILYKIL